MCDMLGSKPKPVTLIALPPKEAALYGNIAVIIATFIVLQEKNDMQVMFLTRIVYSGESEVWTLENMLNHESLAPESTKITSFEID